jgi:hypothetical protein
MSEWAKFQTHASFADPLVDWIDAVKHKKHPPEDAFAALLLFFGHALAGAALEFGIRPDPIETGVVIGETFESQLHAAWVANQ